MRQLILYMHSQKVCYKNDNIKISTLPKGRFQIVEHTNIIAYRLYWARNKNGY